LIYADSSALVKLVIEEPESRDLKSFLDDYPTTPVVSCALARVEVVRSVRIADATLVAEALAVCADLDVMAMTDELLAEARDVAPRLLGTIDAIHLASAKRIAGRAGLTAFVAYDDRLLEAAGAAGLPTQSPGA